MNLKKYFDSFRLMNLLIEGPFKVLDDEGLRDDVPCVGNELGDGDRYVQHYEEPCDDNGPEDEPTNAQFEKEEDRRQVAQQEAHDEVDLLLVVVGVTFACKIIQLNFIR